MEKIILPENIVCEIYQMGFGSREVGEMFHCSYKKILDILINHNCLRSSNDARKLKFPELIVSEIYEMGFPMVEVGDMFHCSHKQIRRILKKNNTHIRTSSEAHSGEYNPNYNKTMPEETKQKMLDTKIKNTKKNGFISSWEDLFHEKILRKIFNTRKIARQFYLKGLAHPFDFAIPELNLLFEVDGDHWHDNPEGRKRDAEIDLFAQNAGWKVFRYNDAALKKMKII